MKTVAEKILKTRRIHGPDGTEYSLKAAIDNGFGEHLQDIIAEIRPKYTLEIGLAYGISSLYICEALQKVDAKCHTVIDPYQTQIWHGAGLHQLQTAGYESILEFTEEHPHTFFPRMLAERGEHLDFCFIDGPKRFDLVMVNAFYLMKMLRPGGVLFFDDVNCFEGVAKVCRFIAQLPNFEVYRPYRTSESPTLRMQMSQAAKRTFGNVITAIPSLKRAVRPKLFLDAKLDMNAGGVGFQKSDAAEAAWDFYSDF